MSLAGLSLPSAGLPDVGLGPLSGLLGSSRPPIYTQYPKVQSSLQRKYSDPGLQAALASIPGYVRTSFVNYDLARAARGQMPLTGAQTLGALRTATEHIPATPPPAEGLLGRALSDIRSLVDIPHVVSGLVGEAEALPEAPAKLAEVLGRGDPREVVAGLGEVPGLRLVPGVYTASTLAQGGPGALLEHPVYTALDVLPYAKAPVAKLADAAVTSKLLPKTAARVAAAAEAPTAAGELAQFAESLGFPAAPAPSNVRLALRTSPRLQAVRDLPPMQWAAGKLGGRARNLSQLEALSTEQLRRWVNPETPDTHPALVDEIQPLRASIKAMRPYVTSIDDARRLELTGRMETESLPDLLADRTLSDNERAFVNAARDQGELIGDYFADRGWGLTRVDGEILRTADAGRLARARTRVRNIEAVNTIRNLGVDAAPGVLPAFDVADLLDERITPKTARHMAQGLAKAYDVAGFDASGLADVAGHYGATKQQLAAAIRDFQADPAPRPIMSRQEVLDHLGEAARREAPAAATATRGTGYSRVEEHVRAPDWVEAARRWRQTVGARRRFVDPRAAEITDALDRYRDYQRWQDRSAIYDDKILARNRRRLATIESRLQPARFYPKAEELFRAKLRERFSNDPAVLADLDKGYGAAVSGLRDHPEVLREVTRDVWDTVGRMRTEGFNPTYVHRVSPGAVNEIRYPRVSDFLRTPSQVKARALNAEPYVRDATVAVTHQALEGLNRIASEQFIDRFERMFTKSQAQVLDEYRPLAERDAARHPQYSEGQHAARLASKGYVPYDPTTYFAGSGVPLNKPTGVRYIPRALDRTLKDMFHPDYKIQGVIDPVMNLFRMSVLAFSPRFHLNNTLGGMMLLATEEPGALPFMVANWKRIREFAKAEAGSAIPGLPPGGIGMHPAETMEWLDKASLKQKTRALHDIAASGTMARWMDEAAGYGRNVAGYAKRVADRSYQLNQVVDDFYRATAYLYGHDRSLVKGLSEDAARARGVALVRKVLPEWDRFTPFERNVVRSVFPFYSFSKFILDYAMRYPMDHPFRTAVMASLVRNEHADAANGWLPSDFAKMFFLGHPDRNGNVKALNPGGINPFADVSTMFSIGGLTGRLNPILSTALETLGVDPSKGEQDLYPDMSYDPRTGQLKPANKNLLSSLIGNIVPQADLVTALIGRNHDFAATLRSNPEAARTRLLADIGFPTVYRQVNPTEAAFKAEVRRQSLQDQVRNEALRSGDWSKARKYPGLRPFFDRLDQVMKTNPQLLAQYQSQIKTKTIGDILPTALVPAG